jgi:hypothetical protein
VPHTHKVPGSIPGGNKKKNYPNFFFVTPIFLYYIFSDFYCQETLLCQQVDFLERDFERDHLAEKSNWTKLGQKIHCAMVLLGGDRER